MSTPPPASTPPASPPSSGPAAPGRSGGSILGTIVCRAAIPLWLLAGAVFKLAERNPNLLPPPVKSAITQAHALLGAGTLQEFMNVSMRGIIAVEIVLAAGMIFLPRLSRRIALATLGLFIAILGWLIATGQTKCGCFGAAGPSPVVMIIIDGALFLLAAFFGPLRRGGSTIAFVVASLIGAAIAFGLPDKAIALDPSSGDTPSEGGDTPAAGPGTDTPVVAAPAWPPVPEVPQGFYMPDFGKWVGRRLSDDPMMHLLSRPLPEGIDSGKWHVVFYRVDCDHCQAVLNRHFAGPLETRTLLVAIPDSTGEPLPLDVTDAIRTQLLRGANGPDYVIAPPVVVTVVDGVVKAVCENPDDEASLRRTLEAQ